MLNPSALKPFEIIDLSHTLTSGMSIYPGAPKPLIQSVAFMDQQGFREKRLELSTHHGTHLDCPSHMLNEGSHLGEFALTRFIGKGFVYDCSKVAANSTISKDDLCAFENEIVRSDFLLFHTGMDKHWNTPLYQGKYPVLRKEAAEYLTRFRLKGIGIDTFSVDPVNDTSHVVHKTLLSGNLIIIENLTGLASLQGKDFLFCCFPLKIEESDGSPVRAVALMNDEDHVPGK
jgi:kynurenine formamidase